ncbi:unnamed protein product [Mytilus edulis]|uniref:Uncharacterized protein n=1 Tax=Mytilus edulis TaxID=6550 RepID=A0A8S3V0Z2_MYTED|nr:unnamed protein product [Mytilus edulis]
MLILVLVSDPPENRPIIRQVKPGPVDSGDTVYLHCSVYGGYPIAKSSGIARVKLKTNHLTHNPEVKFENNVLELYAVEGENLTVKCLAYGNPKAMVHWEESNIELTVPEDSGPRSDYRYPSLPSKIAVAFNESLELAVRLVAFPSPLLNWYLRDTKLNFSTYVLGSSVNTTIYVPKIQKTYLGRYTLNAINNAGSHIININVVEKGKPDMPSVLNLSCGSTTAKIVWTVPFDGGDIQKFRVHYWADDSGAQMHKSKYLDDPGEEKSLEYETQGLREKTVYFFQIIASNSLGSSTTTVKCNTTGIYKQCQT